MYRSGKTDRSCGIVACQTILDPGWPVLRQSVDAKPRRRDQDVMELRILGGAQEVGRSAVLLDEELLLDYGVLTGTPPRFPIEEPTPDAVVVSHAHLDHAGALPALLSGDPRPTIHWTPPTRDLAIRLARDALDIHGHSLRVPYTTEDIRRLSEVSEVHDYGETFDAAGHEITLYDAGHIPGSAHILVDDGETRLLYTGDFATEDQRLVSGTTARPDADVLLIESTYADTTRPNRSDIESQFVDTVTQTLWEGGTVVIPAFAVGRTQEVLLICAAHDIPCYVDGMGTEITEILLKHPEFLRDSAALRGAKRHGRIVTGGKGQRERIANESTAIVTTSGMLQGGPVHTYIPAIRSHPTNTIALTGYQVEGTPGRRLLETGRARFNEEVLPVAASVEAFDLSAHADRSGLDAFLEAYREAIVLAVHGDRTEWFAEQLSDDGFTASAPAVGESITIDGSQNRKL